MGATPGCARSGDRCGCTPPVLGSVVRGGAVLLEGGFVVWCMAERYRLECCERMDGGRAGVWRAFGVHVVGGWRRHRDRGMWVAGFGCSARCSDGSATAPCATALYCCAIARIAIVEMDVLCKTWRWKMEIARLRDAMERIKDETSHYYYIIVASVVGYQIHRKPLCAPFVRRCNRVCTMSNP